MVAASLLVVGSFVFGFAVEEKEKPAIQSSQKTAGISDINISPVALDAKLEIPILVYHHIGTPNSDMTSAAKSLFIEPEWLLHHMEYLQKNGFRTVRFSDIAAYFEDKAPLPLAIGEKPIIISFDDGYKSTFEFAAPILKKYGMAGTVFIPTNLVGLGRGKGTRMTWDEVKALADAGFEIGSHSLWHPYLTKSGKARAEIFESKKILEEKLGQPIEVFAYPFGDYNSVIESLVKEAGYKTARSFSNGSGINRENLFHMPVVRVWGNMELEIFLKN